MFHPTNNPTYYELINKTIRKIGIDSYRNYSLNIIDLNKERNMTYVKNYKLPSNEGYCITCLLSWTEIDATIDVIGCPNNNQLNFSLNTTYELGNNF